MNDLVRFKHIISNLVEIRLLEKFWDPELHPRVRAGVSSKGGQFTFKGQGTTAVGGPVSKSTDPDAVFGEPTSPADDPTVALSTSGRVVNLDSKVLDVGGDEWNKVVARRLEYEYKRVKPHLEKLVDTIVGGKPIDSDTTYDMDEFHEPESWDEMSNDLQGETEEKCKDYTLSDYVKSEQDNWYEGGGAYDDSASAVVHEFNKERHKAVPDFDNETNWAYEMKSLRFIE
jgi:hypothetical protein